MNFHPINNCSSYLNYIDDCLISSNHHAENCFLFQSDISSQLWFFIRMIRLHHDDEISITVQNFNKVTKLDFSDWVIKMTNTIIILSTNLLKKLLWHSFWMWMKENFFRFTKKEKDIPTPLKEFPFIFSYPYGFVGGCEGVCKKIFYKELKM